MSEPDKHHHLPVFYLKQWAGLDGRVVRYHRPRDQVVAKPIAPKNTGFEVALYRLEGYTPEQQTVIEKEFMSRAVDGPAAEALRILLADDKAALTKPVRVDWTRFLMALHVRNPSRIEQITQQGADGLRKAFLTNPKDYDAIRGEGDPPTLLEWVEKNAPAVLDNFGKQLLPGIITHPHFATEILRMRWALSATRLDDALWPISLGLRFGVDRLRKSASAVSDLRALRKDIFKCRVQFDALDRWRSFRFSGLAARIDIRDRGKRARRHGLGQWLRMLCFL